MPGAINLGGIPDHMLGGVNPLLAVYVFDTFTAADGQALSTHTPDIAPALSSWDVDNASVFDSTGNVEKLATAAAAPNYAWISAGVADGIVSATIRLSATANSYTGLMVHVADSANMMEIAMNSFLSELSVTQNVAGVRAAISTAAITFTAGSDYVLAVRTVGPTMTVFVDDTLEITITDTDGETNTSWGLFQFDAITDASWDNFRVAK